MNSRVRLSVVLLIAQLVILVPVFAQVSPRSGNANAQISFPLPIYLLRGQVEIRGSANVANMTTYLVEFQLLNDDGLTPKLAGDLWFPAILPSQTPVQDGVLSEWNTALVPDGIYALRLTVNVSKGNPIYDVVSPLRIENHPLIFATEPVPVTPNATPIPSATPTAPGDSQTSANQVVVSVSSANVRTGDSTDFPVVTVMHQSDTAVLLGTSSRGTGWYNVRLSDGRVGWMAPTTVSVHYSDTISDHDLPSIIPPTLDYIAFGETATVVLALTFPPQLTTEPPRIGITPSPLPVGDANANLVAGAVAAASDCSPTVFCSPAQRAMIFCDSPFTMSIDVTNTGTAATVVGGAVSVVDTRAADGAVQGGVSTTFPPLAVGASVTVYAHMMISTWYNENHVLTFTIDPNNQIAESSKSDNTNSLQYVLNQGNCS